MKKGVALCLAAALSAVMLAGCNDPVSTVKKGKLEDYSKTLSVGDALGKYSGCADKSQKWTSIKEDKQETVVFTCRLKDTDAFYGTYEKEITDARSGIALLQAMADAFSSIFSSQSPDLTRELDEIIAATKVTRNDINVRFVLDPKGKGKFAMQDFTTDFYWGNDKATVVNRPESIAIVYADKPLLEESVKDRREFIQMLCKLHQSRTVAPVKASEKASKPAASKPAVQAAASQGPALDKAKLTPKANMFEKL